MNSLPLPPQNAVIGQREFFGGKRLPGEKVRCSGAAAEARSSPITPLQAPDDGAVLCSGPERECSKVWRRERENCAS
jgi:hypothetical protein